MGVEGNHHTSRVWKGENIRDRFDRDITYLRISITDKCNLRCVYCMPEEGVPRKNHVDFLSFEKIAEIVRAGASLGIRKVRLTGGEPLVKRGIVDLAAMLKAVPGMEHLAMTTNGTLLAEKARELKKAGLDSLNVSLDTLDPARYREITRCGNIKDVRDGIEAARSEGFSIKINTVVMEETADEEIAEVGRFCKRYGFSHQLINHFSLGRERLETYRFDRPPRCDECNRIRLLADGKFKSCLLSDIEIPVDMEDIAAALEKTVEMKPKRGNVCLTRSMMEIGG